MTKDEIERETYILERINSLWRSVEMLADMIRTLAIHVGLDVEEPKIRLVKNDESQ